MDKIFIFILFFIFIPWFLFSWFGVSGAMGYIIVGLIVVMVVEERERSKLRRTLEDKLVRIEEDLKAEKIENKEWLDGYLSALNWVSRKIGMSPKRAAAVEKIWKEIFAKIEEEKVKKNRLIGRLYDEGKDERKIRAELLKKGFDDHFPDGLDYEIKMEIARLRKAGKQGKKEGEA